MPGMGAVIPWYGCGHPRVWMRPCLEWVRSSPGMDAAMPGMGAVIPGYGCGHTWNGCGHPRVWVRPCLEWVRPCLEWVRSSLGTGAPSDALALQHLHESGTIQAEKLRCAILVTSRPLEGLRNELVLVLLDRRTQVDAALWKGLL